MQKIKKGVERKKDPTREYVRGCQRYGGWKWSICLWNNQNSVSNSTLYFFKYSKYATIIGILITLRRSGRKKGKIQLLQHTFLLKTKWYKLNHLIHHFILSRFLFGMHWLQPYYLHIDCNRITCFLFFIFFQCLAIPISALNLNHSEIVDWGWRPKLHSRWCSCGFGFWKFPNSRACLCWCRLGFRSNGNDVTLFCRPCSSNCMESFRSWREFDNQCGFCWHANWCILMGHCFR